MVYYQKHLFFCTNEKVGKQCCQNARASDFCDYTKKKVREKGLKGKGCIRVSSSGCMGRCSEGPALVIYPEVVWYTYSTYADIDEILEEHVVNGRVVQRLLMAESGS